MSDPKRPDRGTCPRCDRRVRLTVEGRLQNHTTDSRGLHCMGGFEWPAEGSVTKARPRGVPVTVTEIEGCGRPDAGFSLAQLGREVREIREDVDHLIVHDGGPSTFVCVAVWAIFGTIVGVVGFVAGWVFAARGVLPAWRWPW